VSEDAHVSRREIDAARNLGHVQGAAGPDRELRERLGELDRVYTELIRRRQATDLVPDRWLAEHPALAAEADMHAGWPAEVAMAERCRALETVADEARADARHQTARRHTAENARDTWQAIAEALEPDRRARYELIRAQLAASGAHDRDAEHANEKAAIQARADRAVHDAGQTARLWRDRAEGLTRFARILPRLPTSPGTVDHRQIEALAWALAPRRALDLDGADAARVPADVVAAVCLRAVEISIASASVAAGWDVERAGQYRQLALSALGVDAPSAGPR
jgi:hypothetical protein